MKLELTAEESKVIRHALEAYLSDLRQEIVKAEKHEWKEGLRNEQAILKRVIDRLK